MRDSENVFHLAIPCRDLDQSAAFYQEVMGCRIARRYDDRITLDFFGDQVVCHLSPDQAAPVPSAYPRHFGVTFRDRSEFDTLLQRLRRAGAEFLEEPAVRFQGRREAHRTFFVVDPSNNVLEFKHYDDPSMMY